MNARVLFWFGFWPYDEAKTPFLALSTEKPRNANPPAVSIATALVTDFRCHLPNIGRLP